MKIAGGHQTIQSRHAGSQNDCGGGPLWEKPPLALPAQNLGVGGVQRVGTPFQPPFPGSGLSHPVGILGPGLCSLLLPFKTSSGKMRSTGNSWWMQRRLLPRRLSGKESACQYRRREFDPWGQEDPLEEEMVTRSSILAWKISWTEEPRGLQSLMSQRGTTEHALTREE